MKLDDAAVLSRYKKAIQDADQEHKRVCEQADEYFKAYGLNSIQGRDFAELQKVWKDHPPEIGIILSVVNSFLGQLISSRREPTFPGFDMSPGDEVIGEMLSLLLNAGRRWAGSSVAEEQSLMDLVIAGLGFGQDFLETDERPPFRPQDRYLSLSQVWWDVNANLQNLSDGQEWIVRWPYSADEAAERFPDHQEAIRAFAEQHGNQTGRGAVEGAQALGGRQTSVTLYASDGRPLASSSNRRLREIPVDDFQFKVFEALVTWGDGAEKQEAREEEFTQAMEMLEEEAAAAGQPFQKPQVTRYVQGTWYRARIMAETISGEPEVLVSAAPIPGNRPLVKCLTGYPERYKAEDGRMKTRWFAFGKALLGYQRLASVAIRIFVEQEARRNRSGGAIDESAFPSNQELQKYVDAVAVPGAMPVIPDGAWNGIHHNEPIGSSHVPAMQQLFQFLSVELPAYTLGVNDITRGTFESDRSTKYLAVMQETQSEMQTVLTSSFTGYLQKGAITMVRLLLDGLDAEDLDRLLGRQPLREGINAVKDETGALVPMPVMGPGGQPEIDPATGQPVTMTVGRFLKQNVGEIFDYDISFALRPSAASERMAQAMLMTQHGFLETLASLVPWAGDILAPAALKGSFAQGTSFADAAVALETEIAKRKRQVEEQEAKAAQLATDQGWLAHIQGLAAQDFEKAAQLMQAASEAVASPQPGGPPQQIQ